MNKKTAIALAVGAMFAAPALAQTVEIYGKLYPQVAWTKTSGATAAGEVPSNLATNTGGNAKGRGSVDVANSYVGFRGNERLGGSLSAIWQIEQAINFDTGGSPDAFWANRNSFLGLRGGFGTVKLGNMDTIYKEYGDQFSMFGINSGNFTSGSNTLSMIGIGRDNSARFHERRESSIQYETPEFGGFQAGIQYGPDESKGNPGNDLNANLWSFGIKYEAGPWYASVQHERHNDFFGGSNNAVDVENSNIGAGASSKDTGTRLTLAFKLTKDHTLTGDIARLTYKETGGLTGEFQKYQRTNWAVGWEARWGGGPFRTGIQFVHMNEGDCDLVGGVACSTEGLDGNQLSLGAAYDLSKRTFIYALFARLKNGESSRFDNWPNGNVDRGADSTQMALGVQHRF